MSIGFTPLGSSAQGPSPEICVGELAGAETTLDTVVAVTLHTTGTIPGLCWHQSPHVPGLARSTMHRSHGRGRAKVG